MAYRTQSRHQQIESVHHDAKDPTPEAERIINMVTQLSGATSETSKEKDDIDAIVNTLSPASIMQYLKEGLSDNPIFRARDSIVSTENSECPLQYW